MADLDQQQTDNGSIGDALDLTIGGDDYNTAHHIDNNDDNIHYYNNDNNNAASDDLFNNLRKTKSNEPSNHSTASPKLMPSASSKSSSHQFARRPSDDDFAKMSMLSMRGGGFVIPRGGNNGNNTDPEIKLPEIPEAPFDLNLLSGSNTLTSSDSGIIRTQSERFPRGHRHHHSSGPRRTLQNNNNNNNNNNSNGGEDVPDLPPSSTKTPSRIPSFRIPSKLRVLPQLHGQKKQARDSENDYDEISSSSAAKRETFVDETLWNDESGSSPSPHNSTPQNELAPEFGLPRSRASTLDRRSPNINTTIEVAVKSSPVISIQPKHSWRRGPPPSTALPSRRLMSKRRSVSDLNIPMSLQQTLLHQAEAAATVSAPRQSIHFDESKKSLGRWLAKMLLGTKYGADPACHRVRRLSREAISEIMNDGVSGADVLPQISRVLIVGEPGVGKHELARNFRSIGASANAPQSIDDPLNDIISRGTSISDNSSDNEIDLTQLVAFEYNDRLSVLDFVFADSEEEFVRYLIQKPPHIIVAVFSVCSTTSLDFCLSVMDRLKNQGCEIPLALVGNKCDLVVARTVSKQESRAVAKQYGITLLEISALLGEKCPELLMGILRQINAKQQHSSSSSQQQQQQQQHEKLAPQGSNGSGKSSTIWSRLSKTFSK